LIAAGMTISLAVFGPERYSVLFGSGTSNLTDKEVMILFINNMGENIMQSFVV
jgi:hypothetical protein